MKICPQEPELVHADTLIDRQGEANHHLTLRKRLKAG